MKILLQTASSTESGPVFLYEMARGFKQCGIDVYVVIPKYADNVEDYKKEFDANHLFLWSKVPSLKNIFSYLANLIKLAIKFKGKNFDCTIINNTFQFNYYVSKITGCQRVISILHDPAPHSGKDEQEFEAKKKIIRKSDAVIVLSKQFIPYVNREYGFSLNNIYYMRHGLMNYPAYSGSHDKKYDANSVNFLFFGRIDQYKGLHVLAKAYEMVSEKHEDISLTIAGNGDFSPYFDEYSKLKNTEVINKYITDDDISELFTRPNTVLVLPYLDATQSGVVGMAYNYELPIIISDTGGLKEQLLDGAAGIFVKPGDVGDLAKKMEYMIVHPEAIGKQKNDMIDGKSKMQWDYIMNKLLKEGGVIS